jgi:hypothetical protein
MAARHRVEDLPGPSIPSSKKRAFPTPRKTLSRASSPVIRSVNDVNTKKARAPLSLNGRLLEIIQEQQSTRDLSCPYVFHHNGRKIGKFLVTFRMESFGSAPLGTSSHSAPRKRRLERSSKPTDSLQRVSCSVMPENVSSNTMGLPRRGTSFERGHPAGSAQPKH